MSKFKIIIQSGLFFLIVGLAACSNSGDSTTETSVTPEVKQEIETLEAQAADLEAVDSEIEANAKELEAALLLLER